MPKWCSRRPTPSNTEYQSSVSFYFGTHERTIGCAVVQSPCLDLLKDVIKRRIGGNTIFSIPRLPFVSRNKRCDFYFIRRTLSGLSTEYVPVSSNPILYQVQIAFLPPEAESEPESVDNCKIRMSKKSERTFLILPRIQRNKRKCMS